MMFKSPLWCVALLALLSLAPVCFAQSPPPDDLGPFEVVPRIGKPEGTLTPRFLAGVTCKYPQGGDYGGRVLTGQIHSLRYIWSGSGYVCGALSSSSGIIYNYPEGRYIFDLDATTPAAMTMSQSNSVELYVENRSVYTSASGSPYALGVTLVKVSSSDGGPLPNLKVIMSLLGFREIASEEVDGKTDCTFGQGLYHASDSPYPPGMAAANYDFTVSADGYAPYRTGYAEGNHLPNQTVTIVMSPDGRASSDTIAPTTPADNPDVPPGTGTGGTGGTGGSIFSLADLMAAISKFFTLDPADLDALKSSWSSLASYGPLSLPPQIVREYNAAFSRGGTAGDAGYWILPLHIEVDGPLISPPAGYTGQGVPVLPASDSHFFSGLFPQYLDLTPYSGFLLRGRALALVVLWGLVAFNVIKRFTPDMKV